MFTLPSSVYKTLHMTFFLTKLYNTTEKLALYIELFGWVDLQMISLAMIIQYQYQLFLLREITEWEQHLVSIPYEPAFTTLLASFCANSPLGNDKSSAPLALYTLNHSMMILSTGRTETMELLKHSAVQPGVKLQLCWKVVSSSLVRGADPILDQGGGGFIFSDFTNRVTVGDWFNPNPEN